MYYLIFGILWLFSLLPLAVLYVFADLIYLVLYYIVKYRRSVVMSNLAIAFPEKSEKERIVIAKKFYHNFIDTFIESLKFISISKRQILRRATGDFQIVNDLIDKGYNVHIMAGHQFNWEFGNALCAITFTAPWVGVYMPISNKVLDRIFYDFRGRYGTVLISATDFKTKVNDVFSKQYTFGLAADQNPGDPANGYWLRFFGKPVPFVTGPWKGAVKNNTAVVMVGFNKTKRGHYHFSTTLLAERGAEHKPQELTALYRNALENVIREDPSNYLWSHRRWKYDWKPDYGPVIE